MSELLTQLGKIDVKGFFDFLINNGWIQILFPFLLIYAIVFSVSQSVGFMRDRKGVRVLVSVIISFFAVTFPVGDGSTCESPLQSSTATFANPMFNSSGCTLGDYMSLLFPGVTILSMMILAIYIIAQLFGIDLAKIFSDDDGDKTNKIIPFILIGIGAIMIGYFTLQSLGLIDNITPDSANSNSFWAILSDPLLWTLIVFGVIFYFVGGDPNRSDSGGNTGGTPPAAGNSGGSE